MENEEARQNALRDLRLLDTPPSESFDRITRIASRLLDAPVSTISLTDRDRQWFKSRVGISHAEIPREQAPCNYAIRSEAVFVVHDLLEDERFESSPLAQAGIRFYAGAPLITRAGYGLGTLCIVDDKPRALSDEDGKLLKDLAGMVMSQIELQNTVGRVDATTGHANQHQLSEDLESLAGNCPGAPHVGLLIELVSARKINQGLRVLGAVYVEELIRSAATKVQHLVGAGTRLYQVSPTACVVILEDGVGWRGVAESLIEQLSEPVICSGVPITPDPVIGGCRFAAGGDTPRDVIRRMYGAVDDARDTDQSIALYDEARDAKHARGFTLITDMRRALDRSDELALVYQPRIDVASGRCTGAEALLRWQHPTLGNVPPGEFIPMVEQTALARPVTEWVVDAALRQAAEWQRRGLHLRVSINASAFNLEERDFADRLLAAMQRHGVGPNSLELEFTESALARNSGMVVGQMQAIRRVGVDVAIDDFGTGYSSLSYLQQLPASVLKIDRSFMRSLDTQQRDEKLVRAMIGMGHDLGYRVVAEGIETREVYDRLGDLGCDEAQGYYLSRPMPSTSVEDWLRRPVAVHAA